MGIATGYRLDDRGVEARLPVGSRILHSLRRPDRLWAHLALLVDTGALFLGLKRPRRETNHSPLASAKIKTNLDLYINSP
jgi:hypothetical protein